jgi:hypothetical protein
MSNKLAIPFLFFGIPLLLFGLVFRTIDRRSVGKPVPGNLPFKEGMKVTVNPGYYALGYAISKYSLALICVGSLLTCVGLIALLA